MMDHPMRVGAEKLDFDWRQTCVIPAQPGWYMLVRFHDPGSGQDCWSKRLPVVGWVLDTDATAFRKPDHRFGSMIETFELTRGEPLVVWAGPTDEPEVERVRDIAAISDAKKHVISIDSDFLRAGYHAACTCGWCGPRRMMLTAARSDGFEHEATCEQAQAES